MSVVHLFVCFPFSTPFSVSAVIPQELLSSISLHISLADSSSPTIFNIHPAFSLHRLTSSPAPLLPSPPNVTHPDRPITLLPAGKAPLPLSAASSRAHLQIWSRVSMKSALQSALASNIHQPVQSSVSIPSYPTAPRLPPLALGSIDLIGEIFSSSHFDLDVNSSPITGPQVRHDRTLSVPTTNSQAVPAGPSLGIHYLQNKRPHPK